MSGISSSTGLISGLNTSQIISQLLSIEARPKALISSRVLGLQTQQAAYLDLNSKINSLKAAAQKLRLNKLFDSAAVASSKADVLTGTASPGTPAGDYSFIVDRVVSTHQLLSRGFVDRNTSGLGLTSLTVESTQARLDSTTQLANLNGGNGVVRGKIIVTNRAGTATTIDLSRAASVDDVLAAFNTASAGVAASISGGRLVLTDTSGGGGSLSVQNHTTYTTATSLGIQQSVAGATLTGSLISYLGDNTTIQSLNDGNGIRITTEGGTLNHDLVVTARDGTTHNIDIGDLYNSQAVKTASAVTTIGQLRSRIESQTGGKITVAVKADGAGIQLVDTTGGTGDLVITDRSGAAADLGFTAGKGLTSTLSGVASADSKTLLAALGSRLTSNIRGGQGLGSGAISITARDGSVHALTLDGGGSISDLLGQFSAGTGGKITAALDANGTSIVLTDTTGGGSNLIISGDAATALGLATAGVASSTKASSLLNRRYVSESTPLASLNSGRGIGTGTIKIIGASGTSKNIAIGDSVKTVADLLQQLNSDSALGIRARVNDAGNGIIVEKDPAFVGADQKIVISDFSGAVAKSLNLAGTASAIGASNYVDGSYRLSVSVGATDTLDQIVSKVNSARGGISASVVTDGSSGAPFRLKLTSNFAGENGRFQITAAGLDLGATTVSAGNDARVFYGSDDPATAILIKRSSNSIDGVIDGLRADIKSVSTTPVTLTVTRDTAAAVTGIQDFVTSFNTLSNKVNDLTAYNAETQRRGTLLGDSTALTLRSELFNVLQGPASGVGGRYQLLAQVGLKINRDGTISIDTAKLNAAIVTDPTAVKEVFSAFEQTAGSGIDEVLPGITVNNPNSQPRYTQLGVFERVANLATKYIDSVSGVLTSRKKNIDDQIAANNKRISEYDERLGAKRLQLEAKFSALEATLSKLQAQQSSIGGIRSIR